MNWLPREASRKEMNIFLSGVYSPWGPCLECLNFPPLNPSFRVKMLPQWLLSSPSILGRFPKASRIPTAPRTPEKRNPTVVWLMFSEIFHSVDRKWIIWSKKEMENFIWAKFEDCDQRRASQKVLPIRNQGTVIKVFWGRRLYIKWHAMDTLHNPDLSALWLLTRSRRNVIC